MQKQVEYADWSLNIMARGKNPHYENLPAGMSYQGVGSLQVIEPGKWHLPFIDCADSASVETLKKVSTARCARVSYYLPENGKRSVIERDVELCNRLSSSGHWSPFEHVATPVENDIYIGNFRSFRQYRKEYADEHGGDRNGI
jgi:hypothetical protein